MQHQDDRDELEIVTRLAAALAERLSSVVVYGPAVPDGAYPAIGGAYLLIVAVDLEPDTLRRLREPVRWWLGRGRPWPRLFTPELLRASADVFPIELVDLASRHRAVYAAVGELMATDIHALAIRARTPGEAAGAG